uniref:Aspartate/glutamate/uridylate kinase domain-containing protein n=1 Tax=Davidia involucrata TaxID=16924 RepID=A0A5B7AST3_DAVIN
MSTSLHFYGFKAPYNELKGNSHFSHMPSLSSASSRLEFVESMHLATIGGGCRRRTRKRRVFFKVCCRKGGGVEPVLEEEEREIRKSDGNVEQLTCVMKFGGSSVASAERMREVADLILSFPEERPVIVLSAMGKTTNNLLLAGEQAVCCGASNVSKINELSSIKELHLRATEELGVDTSVISGYEDIMILKESIL